MMKASQQRRDELRRQLAATDERVRQACLRAGRSVSEVTVIVVTKTFPTTDVAALYELGVRDIAENKDQEAASKVAELGPAPGLRWHFVGQLQSNKARHVASYADVVHSVDRSKLVGALSRGAMAADREVDALIQVSLDGDPTRAGVAATDVAALADLMADAPGVRLRGVMAVAPRTAPPQEAFARLAGVSQALVMAHRDATWISAGMSGDLEAAVENGATHLRVGAAILGSRPSHG